MDIAIYVKDILLDDLLGLQIKLEDIGMLTKIDLVHFEKIKNPELTTHIERVGIPIYLKPMN